MLIFLLESVAVKKKHQQNLHPPTGGGPGTDRLSDAEDLLLAFFKVNTILLDLSMKSMARLLSYWAKRFFQDVVKHYSEIFQLSIFYLSWWEWWKIVEFYLEFGWITQMSFSGANVVPENTMNSCRCFLERYVRI